MWRIKVSSFTLMELVVGMLISSILAGIVFSSLAFVSRFYHVQAKDNEALLEMVSFKSALLHDFRTAAYIAVDGAHVSCFSKGQVIRYEFEEHAVLRVLEGEGAAVDTFHIKITQHQFFLSHSTLGSAKGFIDAAVFQVEDHSRGGYSVRVQRNYTMAERMKLEHISEEQDDRLEN